MRVGEVEGTPLAVSAPVCQFYLRPCFNSLPPTGTSGRLRGLQSVPLLDRLTADELNPSPRPVDTSKRGLH